MDPEVSVLLQCEHWRGLLESQVQVDLSERYCVPTNAFKQHIHSIKSAEELRNTNHFTYFPRYSFGSFGGGQNMIVVIFYLPRFNRQTDSVLERHINEVWTERLSKEPWLFNGAKFRLHSFCLASPTHPSFTYSSYTPSMHSEENQDTLRGKGDAPLDGSDITNGCIKETKYAEGITQQKPRLLSRSSSTSEGRQFESIAAECHPHSGPPLLLRLGLTCYKDYLGTNWSCQAAELRLRGETKFNDPLALLAQPLGVGAVLCTDDGQVVFIRRSQKVAEAGGLLDIPGGHPEPKVT